MTASADVAASSPRTRDRMGVLVLIALLAACGWLLHLVGGWPHLPPVWPSWRTVGVVLQGSYVPDAAALYLVTSLVWLAWLWITFWMLVHAAVVVAERLGPGGPWLTALRAASNRFTLPIVRRTVEAAFVATFLLNVGTRAAPLALAASTSPVAAAVGPFAGATSNQPESAQADTAPTDIEYTVQAGDTLWAIASHYYQAGTEYPQLIQANAGRTMPDGRTFTTAGVLQPGDKLRIPLPSPAVDVSDGQVRYIVQRGDTLSDIAARLLGNEDSWHQLYAVNRNVARLPDGRVLTSPDLIWAGLRIVLPIPPPAKPARPAPQPVSVPASPPITAAPAPAEEPAQPANSTTAPSLQPITVEVSPQPATTGTRPPLTVLYGLAGGVVAAGGAVTLLAGRRRARRSLQEPLPATNEDAPPVVAGFAEAELSRGLSHRLEGDELDPAVVVAGQVSRFLADRGLSRAAVLAVRQGGNGASVLLEAGLRDQREVAATLPELQRLFRCSADLKTTVDHDLLLVLRDLRVASLLNLGWEPGGCASLVPMALMPERETLYADWRRAGPALLAGANGSDVETVFVSLLAALTARRSPDELEVVLLGSPHTLPRPLAELPHLPRGLVDQADGDAVTEALREMKHELSQRMAGLESAGGGDRRPMLVLAVAELADLDQAAFSAVEALIVDGPTRDILVLAATGRPDAVPGSLVDEFTTRLVLRTVGEDQSQQLLGLTAAADLGGGGDLFLRLCGRSPIRGRGFSVSAEHLEELRRLMAEAYRREAPRSPEDESPVEGPAEDADSLRLSEEVSPVSSELPDEADALPAQLEAAEPGALDPMVEEVEAPSAEAELDRPEGTGETAVHVPRPSPQTIMAEVAARMTGRTADTRAATTALSAPTISVSAADTLLDIRCFGGFSVLHQGQPVTPKSGNIRHHKPFEILALLASQPTGSLATDRLLLLMWPDIPTDDATNRLYQNMFRLRETIGDQVPGIAEELVRAERPGFCRLATDVAQSDVARFVALVRQAGQGERQTAKAAARQARDLYRGDLLAGMPYPWLHERLEDEGVSLQERYLQDYTAVTGDLARMCVEDGEHEQAAELYKELLRREPVLEDAARNLYRCYAALGDRSSLIQQHRRLEQALADMFDGHPALSQPQPETAAAYQAALAQTSGQAPGENDLRASA